MPADHGSSIKNNDVYEALRDNGQSKSKAAAIADAQANGDMNSSEKGGKAPRYEQWTKDELIERAGELDITGRWDMTKPTLIKALRG
ncbi:Rho termination factor [Actibacterium sp. 188UL27-1]|uniref:DUF7218 family protein n=1 Tax=Actibacterium sp. 188UL27-1 TaxID=2786961 RepID=UPI00195B9F55|nr:Rho termination factor [Actibacterium sp. 188UL27-1]MBM7069917.1 Rho termination factor [Actibacterium sp. 188UL27-1]